TWCGQLQHMQPFRASQPDQPYYLCLEEEGDVPRFAVPDAGQPPANGLPAMKISADIVQVPMPPHAAGISPWLNLETESIYQRLADQFDMELREVSVRF